MPEPVADARAVSRVTREIAQLNHERSALEELGAQLATDEGNLAACIEVVRAECARLTEQLEDAQKHVADVDQQIAAAVEEDLAVTTELQNVQRRTHDVDGELASLQKELGSYQRQLAEARSVCDTTLQHTLQMGYKLRHGLGTESAIVGFAARSEDEA